MPVLGVYISGNNCSRSIYIYKEIPVLGVYI